MNLIKLMIARIKSQPVTIKAAWIGSASLIVAAIIGLIGSYSKGAISQNTNGNNNLQASTTGNNSPITQIKEQKIYLPSKNNQESRPYVEVELVSPILKPDRDGITRLRYRLKNSENMVAYDIRKGHRIFNEKNECLKHHYDFTDQYLLDLAPGAKSLIHPDRLEKPIVKGKESDNKLLKLQLIITYKESKAEKGRLYYSLENYVLIPINFKEGYSNEFLITKPSSYFGIIEEFIDECKEFK